MHLEAYIVEETCGKFSKTEKVLIVEPSGDGSPSQYYWFSDDKIKSAEIIAAVNSYNPAYVAALEEVESVLLDELAVHFQSTDMRFWIEKTELLPDYNHLKRQVKALANVAFRKGSVQS